MRALLLLLRALSSNVHRGAILQRSSYGIPKVLSWASVVSHSEQAADAPLTSGRNGHARVFAWSVPFVGGGDASRASHPVEVVHATVSPLLLHPPGRQVLFCCVYFNVLITTKHETEASGARGGEG